MSAERLTLVGNIRYKKIVDGAVLQTVCVFFKSAISRKWDERPKETEVMGTISSTFSWQCDIVLLSKQVSKWWMLDRERHRYKIRR
jgi:hypothetical protein